MNFPAFDSNIELFEAFLFQLFKTFINYVLAYFNIDIEI